MRISWKIPALIGALLALGGCVKPVSDDLLASPEFIGSGNSIVVMDPTHIPEYRPMRTAIQIEGTQANGEKFSKSIGITTRHGNTAFEFVIPPGEYGIMSVNGLHSGKAFTLKNAGILSSMLSGAKPAFTLRGVPEWPLATFSVKRGEVVDIGGLHMVMLTERLGVPSVAPLSPEVLAKLKESKPQLAAAMVTRLMRTVSSPDVARPANATADKKATGGKGGSAASRQQ